GGIDVQHERIDVASQGCNDERHALCHQAGDEMHVTAQSIEFCDHDRRLEFLGVTQRLGELWTLVERIGTLAGLHLDKFTSDLESLVDGELRSRLLGLAAGWTFASAASELW